MTELSFFDVWYWLLLGAILSYFIGCFNFAVLISHFKKSDIRNIGSGNPGTMNMSRTFGWKIGVINFLCDAFKGALPVLISYFVFRDYVFEGTQYCIADFARFFFGLFVIIGHVFPVTMGFKGGKGIASTMGIFWASLSCETWWLFFVVLAVLVSEVVAIFLTEIGSMCSLLCISVLTIWQATMLYFKYSFDVSQLFFILTIAVLVAINLISWLAHHENIVKIMAGEEHHTSVKKLVKKKK